MKGKIPTIKVLAARDVKKHDIELMAFTQSIAATADKVPANAHELDIRMKHNGSPVKFYITAPRLVLPDATAVALKITYGSDAVPSTVPFWLVGTTSDPLKANMDASTTSFVAGIEGRSQSSVKVAAPTMINNKALKAGDELLRFKPAPVEVPEPRVAKPVGKPAVKKPKAKATKNS